MNKESKKTTTLSKILGFIAIIAFAISAVYIGQSFAYKSPENSINISNIKPLNREENTDKELSENDYLQDRINDQKKTDADFIPNSDGKAKEISIESDYLQEKINYQKKMVADFISSFDGKAKEISIDEFNSLPLGYENDLVDFSEINPILASTKCPYIRGDRSCVYKRDQNIIGSMEYKNISRENDCIKISNGSIEKTYCDSHSAEAGRGYSFFHVVGEYKGSPVIYQEGYEFWAYLIIDPNDLSEGSTLQYYSESPNKNYSIVGGWYYGSFEFDVDKNNKDFLRAGIPESTLSPITKLLWLSEDTFVLEIKYEDTDFSKSSYNTGDVYYIQVNLMKGIEEKITLDSLKTGI